MNDIAAVPWYLSAEIYEAFRQTASDQADFFTSHGEWLEAALEHERQAEKHGVTIVRVRMDPEAFAAWCAEQSRANDAASRSEFAELRAARMVNWLED
jgi:hypothetical protein